ncbi:DNA-3-methyladenine glycosylase 2 family protein [Vibrio profundi]|uniref:DNA-3-methyladenine glycosylase 2 family protein n=1 Tax=Vibrio profundi TaxID=1774960 RepID=UPI003735AF3F
MDSLENTLNVEQYQKARLARDARFDGQFYIAVKTTGIFCRPICPASPPKEINVEYFSNQALALKAGYRPCLRCRPDSAPSSWAWKGVETTFLRAISLIEQGELQQSTLPELSARLGVSDRYVRMLFEKYVGVSPKQYAQYHQVMFAKQLLYSTSMSIQEVGFACGFNSTRRFNDSFKKALKLTPTQVRQSKRSVSASNRISLSFKGAFDWPYLLEFYRVRAIEGVELIDETSYERKVNIDGVKGWFKATYSGKQALDIEFELEDYAVLRAFVTQVRRMFDLDVDLPQVEAHLESLSPTLVCRSGIRIPGVWNQWEAGVRAVLGQQVSVKAAIGQLNLLVKNVAQANGGQTHFPSTEDVANLDLSFLRMPQSRKDTLKRFAEYMRANDKAHPSEWLALKGIGPWTIQYALLRGLSEPNCFLTGDLIVKKAMVQFPELTEESVAPWGSYATFHCWSSV